MRMVALAPARWVAFWFRFIIRMMLYNDILECSEMRSIGFSDTKPFLRLFHLALPAVHTFYRANHLHARCLSDLH